MKNEIEKEYVKEEFDYEIQDELVRTATDEQLMSVLLFIEKSFNIKESSSVQFENCSKLANFLNKKNIVISEIEAERLLDISKKLNDMFNSLNLANILLRVEQFHCLSILLEMYCIKNGVIKSSDVDFYISKNELDIIKLYLSEIGQYKLLSFEEERELIKRIKNGDSEAKTKIIEHNLRLVIPVAKTYTGYGLSFGDLIQLGNEGLVNAVDKYKDGKGTKFSTYAIWRIKQAITRGIAMHSRVVRIPVGLHQQILKIKKATSFYMSANDGKVPSNEELSTLTGIPVDRIELAQKNMDLSVSLSSPYGKDDSDTTLGEVIEDPNLSVDKSIEEKSMIEMLNSIISSAHLSEREEYIVKARNGFYGELQTLEEIGRFYSLTRERIRVIEKKAMKKLQAAAKKQNGLQMSLHR